MGSDRETGLTGVSGDPGVSELCDINQPEGNIKKKTISEMVRYMFNLLLLLVLYIFFISLQELLHVSMLKKATKDNNVEGTKYHAPVVDVNKSKIYFLLKLFITIHTQVV